MIRAISAAVLVLIVVSASAAETGAPAAPSPPSESAAGSSTDEAADENSPAPRTQARGDRSATPPSSADQGTTISVLDFGAIGNGIADDTAALQAAFDAAQRGDTVHLPASKVFTQTGELRITSPHITVSGGGTLVATREARSSLVLAADGVVLRDVTLGISGTTRRWSAAEQQRLRVYGHSGIVVRNVRVEGSAAAGVFVHGKAANFLLDRVQVSGTRADGIHMTDGSRDGQVIRPVVRDVGDDGVAVVSYEKDGVRCSRITITSPVVNGVRAGRGVTVVGGSDITYRDIDVSNVSAAGVYVAAEDSWQTYGVSNVRVLGGSVSRVNSSLDVDQGAVLVFNGTTTHTVRDVEISELDVSGVPTRVSRWVGAIADAPASVSDVVLRNLALNGPGPVEPFLSVWHITYYTEGWTRDGEPLAP